MTSTLYQHGLAGQVSGAPQPFRLKPGTPRSFSIPHGCRKKTLRSGFWVDLLVEYCGTCKTTFRMSWLRGCIARSQSWHKLDSKSKICKAGTVCATVQRHYAVSGSSRACINGNRRYHSVRLGYNASPTWCDRSRIPSSAPSVVFIVFVLVFSVVFPFGITYAIFFVFLKNNCAVFKSYIIWRARGCPRCSI